MRNAEKFVDEVRQTFGNVVLFATAKEATAGADVVVTVTMATEPVLCGDWLKDGAVVCGKWTLPPLGVRMLTRLG